MPWFGWPRFFFLSPFGSRYKCAATAINITVTLIFHSFSALRKHLSICLSLCFLLFSLYGLLERTNWLDDTFSYLENSHCLVFMLWFGVPFISQISRDFYASRTDSSLYVYHQSAWLNFNLLCNSLWITFPAQSRQIFRASYLHSLIIQSSIS